MTTAQAYIDFKNKLQTIYSEREADNISDWVFENVTGLKKWERRVNPNNRLTEINSNQLEKYLPELLQHKPVQYVLNEVWFYKMKFYVNEDVLIPRPETEELVEWVVLEVRSMKYDVRCEEFRILDVGTGSGCIAVSTKKELENTDVTGIDVSEEALKIANKNADTLQAKINFLQIDFLNESLWNSFGVY